MARSEALADIAFGVNVPIEIPARLCVCYDFSGLRKFMGVL